MKTKKRGYTLFLLLTIFLTLCALSTVIPAASAEKTCYLGYKAHCSFTPFSTLILLILAAAVCKIRKKKFTEEK